MAIGKINRSLYIRALLGVVWASSVNAQAADFKNSGDLLRAIPKAVSVLSDSDPLMPREARDIILSQFGKKSTKDKDKTKGEGKDKVIDEDAILAEAERLLHNELIDHKIATGLTTVSQTLPSQVTDGRINLSVVGGRLHMQPAVLDLSLNGGEASVTVEGLSTIPQVFLRDASKLQWDGKRFHALAQGKTEIFFVYANEMYILPVRIGAPTAKDLVADLASEHLSSLKMPESFAQMPGGASGPHNSADLSIAEASLQVHKTKEHDDAEQKRFGYAVEGPSYRDTAIQVMDVRSEPREGKIFPLAGVTVQLMGLGVAAKTDATGLARFADLPAGSRIWAVVADQDGRIVPTANEIVVSAKGKNQVQRVRTMNYQTYVSYLNILGANQNWSNGSICARAMDATSEHTLDEMTVQINDGNAEGPFYFSEHGPQPGQKQTSANGRFCFFNVKPGLAEISFFHGGNFETALTLPIFPGAHSEEDLPLNTGKSSNLYLASFGSAMDQLTGDDAAANRIESVVTANVISVGDNIAMPGTSENVLSTLSGRSEFKGRTYSLVQTAEFENTLQAQDNEAASSKHMPVLPLLPRGFVEDVFTELNQDSTHASIAFDPSMGQLVVMHKLTAGEDATKLNITVLDAYGKTIDQGWYFGTSAQGLVKAVFFNMQPGIYSVKVQSANGALSAVDTVAVDFWTTAFVQTGGSLQFDLTNPEVAIQE
ncbi:MAG: hypothetical protein H7249_10765 [Chitinophagaceae bacterium]|nr:hypothetical protein [Oligoflexus sp.]